MFEVFQVFHTYVANVLSDVAKVDLDIAYVFTMAFKCILCFRRVL